MEDVDYISTKRRNDGGVSIVGQTLFLNSDGEIVTMPELERHMSGFVISYLLQGNWSDEDISGWDEVINTSAEAHYDSRTDKWLRENGLTDKFYGRGGGRRRKILNGIVYDGGPASYLVPLPGEMETAIEAKLSA